MAFPVFLMCMCSRYKELESDTHGDTVCVYGCLRTGYGPVTKKQTFLGTKSVSVWEAVRGGTGLGSVCCSVV
jgi:hypothetical protein